MISPSSAQIDPPLTPPRRGQLACFYEGENLSRTQVLSVSRGEELIVERLIGAIFFEL